MKITYLEQTKRAPDLLNFEELQAYALDIFNINKRETYLVLFYMDNEGDVISVTNQADLTQALEDNKNKTAKFALACHPSEARDKLFQAPLAFSDMLTNFDPLKILQKNENNNELNSIFGLDIYLQSQIQRQVKLIKQEMKKSKLQQNKLLEFDHSISLLNSSAFNLNNFRYSAPQAQPLDEAAIKLDDAQIFQALNLSAVCLDKTMDKIVQCKTKFILNIKFQNDMDYKWPANFTLKKVGGDDIKFKQLQEFVHDVLPKEIVGIPIELSTPLNPGKYTLKLRLGYEQDYAVFGQEICLNITSKLDGIFNMEKEKIPELELNEFASYKRAPSAQQDHRISRKWLKLVGKAQSSDDSVSSSESDSEEEEQENEFGRAVQELIKHEESQDAMMGHLADSEDDDVSEGDAGQHDENVMKFKDGANDACGSHEDPSVDDYSFSDQDQEAELGSAEAGSFAYYGWSVPSHLRRALAQ